MTDRDEEMVSHLMGKSKGLFHGKGFWEVETTRQIRKGKGPGHEWLQLAPNMEDGGSHLQATLDSEEEEEQQQHEPKEEQQYEEEQYS